MSTLDAEYAAAADRGYYVIGKTNSVTPTDDNEAPNPTKEETRPGGHAMSTPTDANGDPIEVGKYTAEGNSENVFTVLAAVADCQKRVPVSDLDGIGWWLLADRLTPVPVFPELWCEQYDIGNGSWSQSEIDPAGRSVKAILHQHTDGTVTVEPITNNETSN